MTTIEEEKQASPALDPNRPPPANLFEEQGHVSDSDTVSTNTSDEFDWEGEEDEDAEAGRPSPKRGAKIWRLFMKLSRFIRTLLVAILGAGILITPLLIFQFRFKSSPVRPHVHVWCLWLSISWAAGSLTYLVVDSIPWIVITIVTIFHGHVERLKTQLELVLAVSGWLKLALDISWSWVALSVVRAYLNPPGSYWAIVNRVMQALFAAGIILLAEKLFLRFVAIRFHEKALSERLAENKIALKALERLSSAQLPSKKPVYPSSRKRDHKAHRSSTLGFESTSGLSAGVSPDNQGATQQGSLPDRKKRGKKAVTAVIVDQLGDAIGQVALKDSKFNREKVGSLYSARKLARQLFSALSDVSPARRHLVVEDFYPYFRSTSDATVAFAIFDKDSNGDITKKEMREAVQRIYRERKDLSASLKDVGSAVAKLDAVLVAISLMVIAFVCLLIFNRQNTISSLVPLATIVLGFSFIFGHSAQTLFESLIFIFSTHVFDVGDIVLIDDQPLTVKEFGLFSTTFRRVDGQEIIAPNSLLASSKIIHNLRRSGSMWESTKLTITYDTPLEVIEMLRHKLQSYVTANSREWSNVGVNIDKMEFQNAIHLIIAMEHRSSWQDWGGRWARRTLFMRNLKTALEELDIRYTMPIQPVLLPKLPPYNAHISAMGPVGF